MTLTNRLGLNVELTVVILRRGGARSFSVTERIGAAQSWTGRMVSTLMLPSMTPRGKSLRFLSISMTV